MAISLQALRDAKAKKAEEARAIADKENPTEDELKAFDVLMAEAETLERRYQNELKLQGLTDPDKAAATAADALPRIESEAKPVYRNLGEQMLDVRAMTLDTAEAPRARERFTQVVNAAGASTGIDSEGGFLVETDKASSIMQTVFETGVISSRCTHQPIGANSDSFEYMAADGDRDRTHRSGLQTYWKGEIDEMAESGKIKFKAREIRIEDLYGTLRVTNRILRDAVALAECAKRELRKEFAFKLDQAIFEGTGAGQPLGIMKSSLPVTVAKEAGQTAKTIVAANVVNMLARFYGNMGSAVWFVNQDVLPQLPLMTLGQQPIFLPGGNLTSAPFGALLGRPIVPLEFCETLGTKGDIILGDFSEYLLVEKGGLEEAESMHVRFLTDEMTYRFITRVNGQPLNNDPITPLKGTATLSPFVMLAAR